jgi:hypothetical protein
MKAIRNENEVFDQLSYYFSVYKISPISYTNILIKDHINYKEVSNWL